MSNAVVECGYPVNITASGNVGGTAASAAAGAQIKLLGFYVNSTTSGTLVLRKGGSGGTAISGTITPAVGFHPFPADVDGILHATVGGTLDVTFFIAT